MTPTAPPWSLREKILTRNSRRQTRRPEHNIQQARSSLRFGNLPKQAKYGGSTTVSAPPNGKSGWFETPWHYVSIGHGDHQMGMLVGTDDEEEARREAEKLCSGFGGRAKILFVRKVVIQ